MISGTRTNGRYFREEKNIVICAENLASLTNDFQNKMYHEDKLQYYSDAYFLCDLVLIHEYMHAYQHIIEHKNLTHGDRMLEEDANRKAAIIFSSLQKIDGDLIGIIGSFWLEKSEFGFVDNFSIN